MFLREELKSDGLLLCARTEPFRAVEHGIDEWREFWFLTTRAFTGQGLRILIGTNIPCAEIAEASSLIEALTKISNEGFDLVLVSDQSALEPHDFLKSAREAAPATCFAIISACDTRTAILANLAAGFHGFISKQQSDSEILAAISDILAGRIYFADDSNTLGDRFGKEAPPKLSTEADVIKLTKRQREVLITLCSYVRHRTDDRCSRR